MLVLLWLSVAWDGSRLLFHQPEYDLLQSVLKLRIALRTEFELEILGEELIEAFFLSQLVVTCRTDSHVYLLIMVPAKARGDFSYQSLPRILELLEVELAVSPPGMKFGNAFNQVELIACPVGWVED